MSVTVSEIEDSIKLLSLADKKALLRSLLQEIGSHQKSGDMPDMRTTLILEALEDVDTARVVDHADVLAWVDSLGTENPLHTKEYR